MQDDMRMPNMNGGMQHPMPPHRGSAMPWIVLIVVIAIVVIVGFLFRDKLFGGQQGGDTKTSTTQNSGKASGYQAVFLTNGQVYFGKLSSMTGTYVELEDIYYLQVTQPPLQGSQNQGQATQQAQPQLSLVKLGNELHGPVDKMFINRDQVIFYEDIKEDGRVMQAIREYQKNPPAQNSNNNQQTTPSQQNTTPAQ